MREIKFRAWDNKNKKWLLGYEYHNLGGFSMFGETVLMGEWSNTLDMFLFERNGYKNTDLIVMQYTGLKDKNGKEIYEGDLSKNYYKGEWVILEVVWNPLGMWSVKWKDGYLNNYHLNSQRMEIIGNIYQNPELINPTTK